MPAWNPADPTTCAATATMNDPGPTCTAHSQQVRMYLTCSDPSAGACDTVTAITFGADGPVIDLTGTAYQIGGLSPGGVSQHGIIVQADPGAGGKPPIQGGSDVRINCTTGCGASTPTWIATWVPA